MTWKEIAVDQNLQLVQKMLEQQGQIRELTEAARQLRKRILDVVTEHEDCSTTPNSWHLCNPLDEIRRILGVGEDAE